MRVVLTASFALATVAQLGCASHAAPPSTASSSSAADDEQHAKSQLETAKTDTKTLVTVIEAWRMDHGANDCPTVAQLVADKALKSDTKDSDPWGKSYKILCTGNDIGVGSAGPDGVWDSSDDVWSGVGPKL
jgi:hypothetical protein